MERNLSPKDSQVKQNHRNNHSLHLTRQSLLKRLYRTISPNISNEDIRFVYI